MSFVLAACLAGRLFYVPILNSEWSGLGMNDPKFQIADLRSNVAINMDGAANLVAIHAGHHIQPQRDEVRHGQRRTKNHSCL